MKITFIHAAMNAGKSTELLNNNFSYSHRGCYTFLMKPKIDNRHGDTISSRVGFKKDADFVYTEYNKDLEKFLKKVLKNQGILFIDESQFFDRNDIHKIVDFLRLHQYDYQDADRTMVFAYGLLTDWHGKLFEGASGWIEVADNIKEIDSKCSTYGCQNKATKNYLLPKYQNNNGNIIIGDEIYAPLCNECYLLYQLKEKNKKHPTKKITKLIEEIKDNKDMSLDE